MQPLDIAIVGYGTAGQCAALALSRDGHRVSVFERAEQPGPVGAGFLLQPTGLEVLWQLRLLDEVLVHGQRIERLFGDIESGRPVMDMRYDQLDPRLFGLGMQRGALFEILHRAIGSAAQLHAGREIVAVDAERGWISDSDGRREGPFDLVLAADGAASRLRQSGPSLRLDQPYPWGALWCLLPQADWPWPEQLRQRYRAARRMVGVLPVGTRPGDAQPRMSFFWSLRTDAMEQWARSGTATWLNEMFRLWPELQPFAEHLQSTAQLTRASYRDVILGKQWHRDRLVMLGDAAHAMSPQLGQGVNMALRDALALRDVLRLDTDRAAQLSVYARRRRAHVSIYQFWSRWLTPLFQSDHDAVARLRDLALLPLGRMPGGRGNMLRVLTGTQLGWIRALHLDADFLAALDRAATMPVARSSAQTA